MNREFKRRFAVGCLVAAGWTAGGPVHAQAPRLRVHVYNYAEVGRRDMAWAIEATSSVFSKAGIQLAWLDCPLGSGDREKLGACSQLDGTPSVQLNILPKKMAKRFRHRTGEYGVAYGSNALVYHHLVQELAREQRLPESLILGSIMAHELGHALLGPGSHSPAGVMKAGLNPADFQLAHRGMLAFSSEQAARIQVGLRQLLVPTSSAPPEG